MATFVDAEALVTELESASNATTASFSQGSSNTFIFGGAGWVNAFGGAPTMSALKYGGSGGTDITPGDSDTNFNFGNGVLRAGYAIPGPSGTSTIYGAASGGLQGGAAGLAYEDVEDADDFTTNSGVQGDVDTVVGSVTIPNCVTGQTCVAVLEAASGTLTMTAFTAVSGTTIRAQDTGEFVGIVCLEKVATADGNCTVQVNINHSSNGAIGWAIKGVRLIDASGGATHDTSGSLVAQAAALSGAADRTNSHNASGSLAAQAATLSGTADRTNSHNASGSLVAQAATLSGAADRTNSHNASGSLAAQAATLSGSAMVETPTGTHDAIGELEAQAATMSGSADLTSTIETSGALAAQAASLTGAASRTRVHATSGSLVSQAASVAGMAARTEAGTHATEGELVADPATMTGTAAHVSGEGPLSPKFLGGGHKNVKFKPMKREPASQEILQPEITNIKHVKPPVHKRTLLDMLDDVPLPEPTPAPPPAPKAAPAPAPKPKPKAAPAPAPEPAPQPVPPPSAPAPVVDLSPILAANEALTKQVAALSEALAQTQATLQQVLESQAKAAELQEKVAKATEDAERRARNARRAEAIAKKLLED